MAKHGKLVVPSAPGNRAGEGALVDVYVTNLAGTDGKTLTEIGINLGAAPVPDRKYVADVYSVTLANQTLKLMFGQQRISNDGLRSLLIVHMSPRSGALLLESLEQIKSPSLEDIAEVEGFTLELPAQLKNEPEQTVALGATMALVAMAGFDACIDFYNASPFAIRLAPQTKKLAIDPVVRVDIRSPLFLGLTAELKKLKAQLPSTKRSGERS